MDDIVKVYVNNDKEKIMLCDLEDWENLKTYYWREDVHGYAIVCSTGP